MPPPILWVPGGNSAGGRGMALVGQVCPPDLPFCSLKPPLGGIRKLNRPHLCSIFPSVHQCGRLLTSVQWSRVGNRDLGGNDALPTRDASTTGAPTLLATKKYHAFLFVEEQPSAQTPLSLASSLSHHQNLTPSPCPGKRPLSPHPLQPGASHSHRGSCPRLTGKLAPGLQSHPELWVVMTVAGFTFVDLGGFTPVQAWNSCLQQRTQSQSCTGSAILSSDPSGVTVLAPCLG